MLQQPLPDYPLHPIGLSIHPVLFFFPAVKILFSSVSATAYLVKENVFWANFSKRISVDFIL